MLIYDGDLGYIKGYKQKNGYWWISEFVLHAELRGQGKAKELAQYLPDRCQLMATPIPGEKPTLSTEQLLRFYTSLGLVEVGESSIGSQQLFLVGWMQRVEWC
jgi:predicted GNAT superfamily acetyltransferase